MKNRTNKSNSASENVFGVDYFSTRLGYVIEGQAMPFATAMNYIMRTWDMENYEAEHYLASLKRAATRTGYVGGVC